MRTVFPSLLLALLMLFLAPALLAQDAKVDLEKINSAYNGAAVLSMQLDYALYKNYTSAAPSEHISGRASISGSLYYYQLGSTEVIRTKKLSLMVNKDNRTLLLGPPEKKGKHKAIELDYDSIFRIYKSVSYTKLGEDKAMYTFTMKNGQYKTVQLVFNTQTYFIEKVVMFFAKAPEDEEGYTEAPRLELSYSHITTAKSDAELNPDKKYLVQVKGKYQPRPAYKQYRFINKMK